MNHMDDCFAGAPQDFLVCVTVHKAAQTGIPNGELYVKVTLDKMIKNTKTQANSENPFFNEYFVFEFHCTLSELMRLTVLFELKKYMIYKKNVLLGDLLIDLHSVWDQPSHNYFKRWGRLEPPIIEYHNTQEISRDSCGYLQIDLAIVSQHSALHIGLPQDEHETDNMIKYPMQHDFDDIKSNLLEDADSDAQSNIRYFISFYRGAFAKKSSYMIQYRFHPFKGKTYVAKNTATPVWNQEISFAWVYPSIAQRFLILIMQESVTWKCIAEYELSFEDIAFKDKPAFGPTYLHLYDPTSPLSYVGRVLMELRSETLGEGQPTHVLVTQSALPPENWVDETFVVEFLPILGDYLPTSATHYKFVVQLAEHTSNALEGPLKIPTGKCRALAHTKCFRQELPYHSCLLRVCLPDNRIKFEGDFHMMEISNFMLSELETFKVFQLKFPTHHREQAKCLKSIIASILDKVLESITMHRFDYDMGVGCTTWDVNRQQDLLGYFTKLSNNLRSLRKRLKTCHPDHLDTTIVDTVNELHRIIGDISAISNVLHAQDDWPELLIFLSAGGKQLGLCRLNAKHFLSLPQRVANQANNHCWKVRSFLFKSNTCTHTCANCGCNVGIVLGCISIVPERERHEFFSQISGDWVTPEPLSWSPNVVKTFFRCNLYVHQAKIRPGADNRNICRGHVRVLFATQAAETHLASSTCSPIWDTVISIDGIALPGSVSWYLNNPPLVSLELYNSTSEAVGNGQILVSVISAKLDLENNQDEEESRFLSKNPVTKMQKMKNISPPPLKWVAMSKNGIVQAEVLMSMEFIEMEAHAPIFDNAEPDHTIGIPLDIRPNMLNYVLEVIFVGLRNYTKSGMNSAGKRRIKVMMADLLLSSGLSTSRVRNSINFLVSYASGVVSLPDQQEYWPAIIATDVMISSFRCESTLGAAMIPANPNFLQKDRKKTVVRKTGLSSEATSTVIVDPDDEVIVEEAENDKDQGVGFVESCWKRVLMVCGLRTEPYANKLALKYDPHIESTDFHAESRFTWWTKFYNSMYVHEEENSQLWKHRLVIYPNELEKQAQFGYLQDWAVAIPLVHGVKYKKQGPPKEDIYATLKLQIKLTPCVSETPDNGGGGDMTRPAINAMNPRQQALIKSLTEVVNLTVRVYIVQGLQIRPRDWISDSDSYVRLTLAGKMVSDRANYIPNQSNPVFGSFFELSTTLPNDPVLEVSLYDHDKRNDQVIGTTRIDLEDRWQSKHRATVGIAQEYNRFGYNQWRDTLPPSQLLSKLCQERGTHQPYFYGNVVQVDGMLLGDETVISKTEDLQERLSVTVLRNLDRLPSFGYQLVPEHVETRSLYRDDIPGLEQGKIQMWIELFEQSMLLPPPLDITPMAPIGYEIRVVVKNLSGIQFGDKNIFGKLMSDLYVIGWCQDANKYQSTDIHYRSFAGDAAFNWRMIFALKYSYNEDMMVIRRKGGLHEQIEIKRPPIIYLQVWDKDMITRDDFLAAIELNLSHLPLPYGNEARCQTFPKTRQRLNLFNRKSVTGWFPLQAYSQKPSRWPNVLGGKIELQIDVCTETEASNTPAGMGHQPPMELEAPNRPETSFNPLTHPFKSAHLILWPVIRKYVYIGLLVILLGLGLTLFFANLPYNMMSIPLE